MNSSYTIILAPNPSLMTGPGTNAIILGGGVEGATLIDPADNDQGHLDALVRAGEVRGGIRRILITHGHPDHIGGAETLRARLNVPIYAFSRQSVPFADEEIADGATIPAGDDTLRAIHTPGHSPDHLCFLLEKQGTLFAGDLVAGMGTVVIGDLLDYLNSLKRLQEINIAEIVPSHGPVINDPQAKIAEYIEHRLQRERQVIDALAAQPAGATIATLVQHIYIDVDPRLHPVAAHSVEAHLHKLEREGRAYHQEISDTWQLTAT